MDDTLVIIVGVYKGRYFPKQSLGTNLECNFFTYSRQSDVVQYQAKSNSIPWEHTFVFEIKKNTYKEYKQRCLPVKLLFWGIDANHNRKLLGNLIFYLREGGGTLTSISF